MHFKNLQRMGLSLLLLISAGCTPFLDGKKAEPQVIELTNENLNCLKQLPGQLKKYSVGEAENVDVSRAFDCMNVALDYFIERTYGAKEDAYSTDEMRRFFGKYFLKENNVTPEFSIELMKIKQSLLGGSETHITKDEIRQLMKILSSVKDEAIAVNPHVRILLNQGISGEVELDTITAATVQLRQSLQKILQQTAISQSDYTFEDAKNAFSGFAEFIDGSNEFAPYKRYSEWVPLIEAIKNILMGRSAEMKGLTQWSESLDTLLDLYELVLKYHYRLRDFGFEPAKLREFGSFGQQVVRVLNQSQQMKRHGYIPAEDLDILIQETSLRWDLPFSAEALRKVYRVVLLKILEGNPLGDYLNLRGLERKHLRSLYREFSAWRLQQSFIDSLPSARLESGGLTQKELLEHYRGFAKKDELVGLMMSDPFDQEILKQAWMDFGVTLVQPNSLLLNDRSQLQIDSKLTVTKQSWKSLSYMNLMRSLTRLLLLGYGENTKSALSSKAYLQKDALIKWYDDFYELGIELKAFDVRSGNPGGRSFQEANFFTFNGNGDDKLNYLESYHFITTLFTAGLSSAGKLSDGMIAARCGMGQMDPFDKPNFAEACFKQELRRNFATYFANLPDLVKYVQSLSDTDWNRFYGFIAAASEQSFVAEGVIETANIRTLVTIFHYVENVMVLFDRDSSQGLTLEEVYAAAPRFTPFFREVTGKTNDSILTEGFAYLVFKGRIPNALDLAAFYVEKKTRGLPDATRMEILRLFGTLKDQLNPPKK